MSQSIDAISPEFADDVGESSSKAVNAYADAQNTIRNTVNGFKNIVSNIQALSKGGDIDIIKGVLNKAFGLAGSASQSTYLRGLAALSGLSVITIADWQLHPMNSNSPGVAAQPTVLPAPPISNTSTNSSDPDSEVTQEYMLTFNQETSSIVFNAYIATLPDHGVKGYKVVGATWQRYVTNLTQAQAQARAQDAVIHHVIRNDPLETYTHAGPAESQTNNRNVWRRDPSTTGLDLLSMEEGNAPSWDYHTYLFHPSLGSGTTIYVLDNGMNVNHEEFQGRDAYTGGFCVQNSYTGADKDDTGEDKLKDWSNWDPEYSVYTGHGTQVASVAAGKNIGVVSKADLKMLKMANGKSTNLRPPAPPVVLAPITPASVASVLDQVGLDVNHRDLRGKAVVSCSIGWLRVP